MPSLPTAKCFIGRGEETEAHVQEALRLSHVDTNAAGVLLADAAGPLYNRHNHAALPALLRSAIAQLDPAAALAEPAVA